MDDFQKRNCTELRKWGNCKKCNKCASKSRWPRILSRPTARISVHNLISGSQERKLSIGPSGHRACQLFKIHMWFNGCEEGAIEILVFWDAAKQINKWSTSLMAIDSVNDKESVTRPRLTWENRLKISCYAAKVCIKAKAAIKYHLDIDS